MMKYKRVVLPKTVAALFGASLLYGSYHLYNSLQGEQISFVIPSVYADKAPSVPTISPRLYPTRNEQLEKLRTQHFDVLVIGGGATGAGCALDAASRGLKTALIEMDDFSSGTSSRSTKLIHGGVRYLQKAIMNFDREQVYFLDVMPAFSLYLPLIETVSHGEGSSFERGNLLTIAPHLSSPLPIMLPVYKWWQFPYFYAGIKMYDFVSGKQCLISSYAIGKKRALEVFPMLKDKGLVGAIIYYDGQHNDSRMNISIALTAVRYGAVVLNHTEVLSLTKNIVHGKGDDKAREILSGAKVKDLLTNSEFEVKADCIINATGPFTDSIRKMNDETIKPICAPSSGVHIVLPDYYSPENMGLLDPSTSDGRVIFFLPWQNMTIAGTTDNACKITHDPIPSEDEIRFILDEVKNYLSPELQVRRGDVQSAWSGIRPLVRNPNKADTQSIARNHIIEVSPTNLITIAGGKWTTYRAMAEETIDSSIKHCKLSPKLSNCQTKGLVLDGGHNYNKNLYIQLVQDYGIETSVARHLASTYGDAAFDVLKFAETTGKRWPILGRKLSSEYPYIEAEVKYAIKEYACSIVDVIARRTRLAFLNIHSCQESIERIAEIMSKELKWSMEEKEVQVRAAKQFLQQQMGEEANAKSKSNVPINLTSIEIAEMKNKFSKWTDGKTYMTSIDVKSMLKKADNQDIDEEELHSILNEVDLNKNGQIEFVEFLQLMSALKQGQISYSRFAIAANIVDKGLRNVERSGGEATMEAKSKRRKKMSSLVALSIK